jgi:hypothetical protein
MKTIKVVSLALSCTLFLLLTGCASIAGNNTRSIQVVSHPAGAAIFVDNQRYGTTPAMITLPSYIYGGKTITLKKPGFQEQSLQVNTQFQPISLVNLLFWPGFLVDAATGDLVKIDPADLNLHAALQR